MKFMAAKRKLQDMARGKFCSLHYLLIVKPDGSEEQSCSLYIRGLGEICSATWKEGIALMKDRVESGNKSNPDKIKDEAPWKELQDYEAS